MEVVGCCSSVALFISWFEKKQKTTGLPIFFMAIRYTSQNLVLYWKKDEDAIYMIIVNYFGSYCT